MQRHGIGQIVVLHLFPRAERIAGALADEGWTGDPGKVLTTSTAGRLRRMEREAEAQQAFDPPRVIKVLSDQAGHAAAHAFPANDQRTNAAKRVNGGKEFWRAGAGLCGWSLRAASATGGHVAELEAGGAEALGLQPFGNRIHPGGVHRCARAMGQKDRGSPRFVSVQQEIHRAFSEIRLRCLCARPLRRPVRPSSGRPHGCWQPR
ncbi:hypothetical protein SDC9_119331 [bioreactor metagenome]|uniref:Uncharacterized protein n=1 Tax=bioreactor metagenome TaxID=1076179 RepID=A0A645C4Q2_9ZZZZ